ncbi:zinc finger MYM-type protein 1-like [Sipha flava]|uniref:Zinc finger MYM-type protein 1 n=1 Tax=Sipha flava TaxID=143950 RepID=A0A2S2QLG5_9HEMI|nr:zinc finger MYM-type protein 1-like [Sipha flava]
MSKRSYPSGASKRQRAIVKEINEKKIINSLPKLTDFFSSVPPKEETNLVLPISQETITINQQSQVSQNPTLSPNKYFVDSPETVEDNSLVSNDPGNWNTLTEEKRNMYIKKGSKFFQNKDSDFSNSTRNYTESNGKIKVRHLTKSIFTRQLKNGENVDRSWLLYSPSKKALFCFVCRLFSSTKTGFSCEQGFNDWKHVHTVVLEHENSLMHRESVMTFSVRTKNNGRIDQEISYQINLEVNYWKEVLKRIVAVIKFLSSRGIAFRGENQIIGSQHNGNYLGCLELISQFDPFLLEHLNKYGNQGKGNPSYLSANICNEFINIMGRQVLNAILSELKVAKYYSISVDSTPDLSHIDQMTFIIRYVNDDTPVERFLEFIPIDEHGSEYLFKVILSFLEKNQISLNNCRGQSYDNAANMSGQYAGLQARIKEKCNFAIFIPCAAHSLNLVGVRAAECVMEAVSYFQFVQKLYNFFSSSTYRWSIMKKCLGSHHVLKSLSETRWSARADAVTALCNGYKEILDALKTIEIDDKTSPNVKNETHGLIKKMKKLENIVLTEIWSKILSRINETNKNLQKENLTIDVGSKLFDSLAGFLSEIRDNFYSYESSAREKFPDSDYKDLHQRTKKRSIHLTLPGELTNKSTSFSGSEKFKIETYFPIIDTLITQLKIRAKSYNTINKLFGFFSNLKNLETKEVQVHCKTFAEFYHVDINENELILECIHLKAYLSELDISEFSISSTYKCLKSNRLEETFPNIIISFRIFLSMMITNCSGERSFSKLNLIKEELRSTMSQKRLNSLSLMSIEHELLSSLDYENVIEDFANEKARKKPLKSI